MAVPITTRLTQLSLAAVGVAGAAMLGDKALFTVPAGHRAVIFSLYSGLQTEVMDEGTHFLFPFVWSPILYDVRTRPRELGPTRTSSKDLQDVNITIRILFRPRISHLPVIHNNLGVDYGDSLVLPSIGNETLKAVVALYDAQELITQREAVSKRIRHLLTRAADQYNILLDDIAITHLTFSTQFMSAVERKQVAQQDAERQKFLVEIDEAHKISDIIRAEGEAEAAKLISDAYKESGRAHLELRRIETAREVAEVLSASRNVTYLPKSTNILMQMPSS